MASLKKNAKDHHNRRNMGSAEFFRKQRKERNAARPQQVWGKSTLADGSPIPETLEGLDALTDEQIKGVIPAHWER
jgi:hypothetical protein